MTFTSNSNISQLPQDKECIFLAGSMVGSMVGSMAARLDVNWRQTVADNFQEKYHLLDPTNHNRLEDLEIREHIKWELKGMEKSDYIIMNFLPNSLSPISMVELGMYIATNKLIVVCPKEFYKWRYIDTLCKEHNTPIFNELEELLNGDLDSIFNT